MTGQENGRAASASGDAPEVAASANVGAAGARPTAPPRLPSGLGADATQGPPRCWSCYYRLDGMGVSGTCPECGARCEPDRHYDYAKTPGFFRAIFLWWWPAFAGLIVVGILVILDRNELTRRPGFEEAVVVILCALTLGAIVNAIARAYRWTRRRTLRRFEVSTYAVNGAIVAQSFGCAAAVFLTSVVIVAAASCVAILSSF